MSNATATTSPVVHHHALSDALDPADYAFVGEFYNGVSEEIAKVFRSDHDYLAATLANNAWFEDVRFGRPRKSGGEDRGSCALCSTGFAYGGVFRHLPSGELIAVGHICASHHLGYKDIDKKNRDKKIRHARKREENARRRAKASAEFTGFVAANPEFAAAMTFDHHIIADIVEKCREFRGTPSPAMAALVIKIATEGAERATAKAEREAADAEFPPIPVPLTDARVKVSGTVIWTGTKKSIYGTAYKMIVRVVRPTGAFKLYGTEPSGLDPEVGDEVEFMARIERGDRDEDFGFFSRPTKASVTKAAAIEVAEVAEVAVPVEVPTPAFDPGRLPRLLVELGLESGKLEAAEKVGPLDGKRFHDSAWKASLRHRARIAELTIAIEKEREAA